MSKGLDGLKHIVVLVMENRSFDHMVGGLKKIDTRRVDRDGVKPGYRRESRSGPAASRLPGPIGA